jgi:hypothetical protein
MHYIVQDNIYRESNFNKLLHALNRLELSYETINILPSVNDYEFKTIREDVFVYGASKLANIARNKNWKPGTLFGNNHDYQIYSKYYKEHLLNYDSKIFKIGEKTSFEGSKFLRPCQDNKIFNGGVFYSDDWDFVQQNLIDSSIDLNLEVQMASIKKIYREVRLFIVGGKIVTGSQYTFGNRFLPSTYIGEDVIDFANKMINIYQVADCFVLDIAETDIGLKIIEVNCINCSGFYESDVMKLLIALEDFYN